MKRAYKTKNFNADHMIMIHNADSILSTLGAEGFILTLRQLHYQFVSKDFYANTQANYNKLGDVISEARMCGLIDWNSIEDRTRGLRGQNYFKHPKQAVKSVLERYQLDKWQGQPYRPEVWIEKDALIGIIEPICLELGVDYFGCRGYNSQSEQWRAGRRFARYFQSGQMPIVFHLGDHDPSGIDMTRDNRDRLAIFAGVDVQVVRLALNMDQIKRYNPPPNPVKKTDKRWKKYAREYGTQNSWELDALEPKVIASLIRDAVLRVRDEKLWDQMLLAETEDREHLEDMMNQLNGEENEQA